MRDYFDKHQVKELVEYISSEFSINIDLGKSDSVVRQDDILLINNRPLFFYHEGKLYPTLRFVLERGWPKKIIVDMPAVRFIINGADVMRPGIVGIEGDIKGNDAVAIADEKNRKCIAVGTALYTKEEILAMEKGKVVRTLHYVGDKLWQAMEQN